MVSAEEPIEPANQPGKKSEHNQSWHQSPAPGKSQNREQRDLCQKKYSAPGELLAEIGGVGGMDAQLHEMNLVARENPVGHPQHPGARIQMFRDNVIGCWRGACEADCPHHLRGHAQLATKFHKEGLNNEGQCSDAAKFAASRDYAHSRATRSGNQPKLRPVRRIREKKSAARRGFRPAAALCPADFLPVCAARIGPARPAPIESGAIPDASTPA